MAGLSGRALLPDPPECVSIIKPPLISVSAFALKIRVYLYSSVVKCLRLQHLDERLLQDVHVADGFHPLFAFLLLLQQPALAISPFSARFHFMSEKQLALNSIERLPEDASLDVIAERMEFLAAIRKGLDQIERGETIPHEEVKRQLAAWLSK
jgi:hypothetical protein